MQAVKPSETIPSSPQIQPLPRVTLIPAQLIQSPSAFFDSPKHCEPVVSPGIASSQGYPRLSQSKLPIDILFEQIDTSLYLNKIGTFKYFRFKNVLTLGDLCSLSANVINSFPFRTPKLENYLSMIRSFEEKCIDRIKRFEHGQLQFIPPNQEKQSSMPMGSVEEEMEKLESSNSCNLDTSIESEAAIISTAIQTDSKSSFLILLY